MNAFYRFLAAVVLLSPEMALSIPLDTIGTFCGTFPDQCRKGTTSLLAARGTGTNAYYVMEVDPTTGLIPVSATVTFSSEGTPGSAAPSKALQIGGTDGTNLRVLKTDTSGNQLVVGAGTAGTPSGGVVTVQGVTSMTALKVDGSAVTQPVSAASLPLPSGAATAIKQPALGTAGTASADVITVQGITSMTALKVDGSGVTQPVSAASLPLPSGASTAAKQPAPGTAGSASVDVITVQGITSMTALKVDGSAATQPVSGTVSASNFPATADTNTGVAGASTIRHVSAGYPITSSIVASNSYSGTNVTTSAYVQLIASTANAINTLCVSDSSGSIIRIATGGAGSETDRIYLPGGGQGCFQVNIASGTRIALKALDTTASAGYFLLTGY